MRNVLKILFLCLLANTGVFAQVDTRDSLKKLLQATADKKKTVDLLNELSYQNFDIDDSAAIHYAYEGLRLAQQVNYAAGKKYSYTLVGLGLSSSGKRSEAIEYFRLSDGVKTKDANNITTYNLMLWGNLYAELAKYDSSQLLLERARANTKPADFADLQSIYKNLAALFILTWDNQKALTYLDSASRLRMRGDAYMDAEISKNYGLVYQNLAEFQKANEKLNEFCTTASNSPDYYHKVDCYLHQSRLLATQGQYSKALKLAIDALQISSKYNYTQYVEVLTQIGEVYMELTNYELCGQYLFKALKVSQDVGLQFRTALIYIDLAWLTKIEGQFEVALEYCKKAQQIFEQIKYQKGIGEAHNVRGLVYFDMNKRDSAWSEYEIALSIRKNIKDVKGVAATLYNQSEFYIANHESQKAIPILKHVVELEEKMGNQAYLSMTYNLLAQVLVDQKKYGDALVYLNKARQISEKEASLYLQLENEQYYARYYEVMGDYKNAFLSQKRCQELSQKYTQLKNINKIVEYEALHEVQTREDEIELLTQKQKLQEVQLKVQESKLGTQNTIIISVILLAIFLGVASIRVSQLNIQKESINKKLISLNKEISQQRDATKNNLDFIQQLKDALEVREKQYRTIVENASDIIQELDGEWKFVFFNNAIEEVTGFSKEELTGKHYSSILNPKYEAYVTKILKDKVNAKEDFLYLEFPILAKNGSAIWLGQNTRFYYRGAKLWKVAVIARDITKQKQAEEALIKSQREYEDLVESIPIGIFKTITYPNGEFSFLYVSPRWCSMLDLRMNDVLRDYKIAHSVIYPEDMKSFQEAEEKSQKNNFRFTWEGRVNVKGEVRYMRIESRPTRLPNGTVIRNGIQIDVTKRKIAELESVIAKEEALKANSLKSEFIADLSFKTQILLHDVIDFAETLDKDGLTQSQLDQLSSVSKLARALLVTMNVGKSMDDKI